MLSRFNEPRLELAIFSLEDVCVRVQRGMDAHLKTAALVKSDGVDAVFRWLRKRGIKVCLLSRRDQAATELLLERLEWNCGEDECFQHIIFDHRELSNPIQAALEHFGLTEASRALVLSDTPRLLQCTTDCRIHFNLGVTNGRTRYDVLVKEPFFHLLDGVLQLPNFLLEHIPQTSPTVQGRPLMQASVQRLLLSRPNWDVG